MLAIPHDAASIPEGRALRVAAAATATALIMAVRERGGIIEAVQGAASDAAAAASARPPAGPL